MTCIMMLLRIDLEDSTLMLEVSRQAVLPANPERHARLRSDSSSSTRDWVERIESGVPSRNHSLRGISQSKYPNQPHTPNVPDQAHE